MLKAKLKTLSDNRWSCKADASKDLNNNFDGIHAPLSHIAEDIDQKPEALCLLKNITKLEFTFMAVFLASRT